jgi:hypothetical protein
VLITTRVSAGPSAGWGASAAGAVLEAAGPVRSRRVARTCEMPAAGFFNASLTIETITGVKAALNTVPDSQNREVKSAAAAEEALAMTSVWKER